MSLSQLSLVSRRQSSADVLHKTAEQAEKIAVPVASAKSSDVDEHVYLPNYDRSLLETGIVHFGVGGFHRSHQVHYLDKLLRSKPEENYKWAYTGVGVLPHDAGMKDALSEQEYLYTLVAQSKTDNDTGMNEIVTVVGAMKEMLQAPEQPGEVMQRLAARTTRIYSLTITEFGYTVPTSTGDTHLLELAHEAASSPWEAADADPKRYIGATALGYIVAGLAARRASGTGGATILSCDNIPGNGSLVRERVLKRAEDHSHDLREWIEFNCTFPNCMVDRITPITSNNLIIDLANKHHLKDNWPVNCETFCQWVIEDNFVDQKSGRPAWEDVGVQIVHDVHPYELAKIRLLNVIHTAMVFPALLMGLEYIHEAATHPVIKQFYTTIMDREMCPTLENVPGIENIDLDSYKKVLIERFSNVVIADTLQRVAMDTSDKLSVQGVPATLDGYAAGANMKGMAFTVAAWAHFIRRSLTAHHVLRDQKARLVELAMEDGDVNHLLDLDLIFHELIFSKEWRDRVVQFYGAIADVGVQQAMEDMLATYDEP